MKWLSTKISRYCTVKQVALLNEVGLVIILVAVATVALSLRPIGFLGGGHDDIQYINAAAKWVTAFPYIGLTHWELRHPFVLQITAMLLAGFSAPRYLLIIPVIYYCLSLLVAYFIIRYMSGRYAAFFSCIFFATSPAVIDAATELMPDLIEFFFVFAALSIFLVASQRPLPLITLAICGVLLGLSWLTRQTSGAAVLFLLGTFLFQPMFSRKKYLVIAAFAFLIFTIETVWLGISTGDLLYRVHTDMRHVAIPSEHFVGGIANPNDNPILNTHVMSQWVPSSPIKTNWFLDPYLALFTSRHYGALFYVTIPSAIYLFYNVKDPKNLVMVRFLSIMAILWFLFAIYVLAIRPQARYFIPVVFSGCAIVGIQLSVLWAKNKKAVTVGVSGFIVLINILLCDLQQYRNYSADALIDYATRSNQPINISSNVQKSTNLSVIDSGLLSKVSFAVPMIGDIFLIGPRDHALDGKYRICFDDAMKVYEPRPYLLGVIVKAVGLEHFIPEEMLRRLVRPDGVVSIGRRCS